MHLLLDTGLLGQLCHPGMAVNKPASDGVDTSMMRQAAKFWCDSRLRGNPTASHESLDGDIILAAQAAAVDGTIVTTNRKHLAQFVPARDRTEILWAYAFVCIRGLVDNLAFDWKDHFLVQDTQGRSWHCRHEATWHSPEEVGDSKQLFGRLTSDLTDVPPMYQKLFASGHGTTKGTSIKIPITMNMVPASQQALIADLAVSLGEDDAADASDE